MQKTIHFDSVVRMSHNWLMNTYWDSPSLVKIENLEKIR
jgi:hypothetical protein